MDGADRQADAAERRIVGLPLRAFAPNAVTALALCFGLTGVRFAIGEEWEKALAAIIFAGVLDGMDGRIARLLRAQSRFGAELDSLSDVIAFGVAPAMVMFLWSLQDAPKFGWTAALALAVCCALRLARFNSRMDADVQPHKAAGFLTGIPAPAGAGLAFVPVYLWLVTGETLFREWYVVMPWVLAIAMLMISAIPTYGWSSIRLRRSWRLFALAGVGLLGAALVTAPWHSLLAICVIYVALLPFGIASYARVRRRG
ncbi:phosphatidylcholine/phosphatidylserine synthase [Sphingopyxis granuli]|jgi:CDP-diacylglycerol--serine O-phosphatidyltransferase|uniref:CDP-alcohol phosphatidyltransferase family protein n=1 Tax=Sphingopyxis TaxID=165697 RepID=UPI000958307F|nr:MULTISPECIES: phosphatidylcholine/phosphatidylserine synthase [Sphingopyxis]APW73084.1 CDP-diacylglycerol O-phosphatidyltransferase [Sphingopyxis granuli]AVA13296.1 phosphatidylcholine/phosphatidylserine synthase [Sphingopyxis sp. MG]QUM71683.1 phosphatidylcholine/phosphatidylserine synthase [Sphingopyxis granuli]UNK81087.1 phosphatidylcholine/phosphatidylserine synthase [Sphingopyxis granuli]